MRNLYVVLIILSLVWGTSFLFIKLLVEQFSVWEVVFWRCLFGAAILWAILLLKNRRQLIALPWIKLAVIGLMNNSLPWAFIAFSEMSITSSLASVLNATTPIWTAIIGFVFFQRQLKGVQWLGLIIGFAGIVVLTDFSNFSVANDNALGIGTMLLAAACYGFAAQYTRKHLKDVSVLAIATVSISFAAMIGFIFSMFSGNMNTLLIFQPKIFLSFISLGTFGSGLAIVMLYYLIQKGSAEFASTVTYLVPVSAIIWGAVILSEPITLSMITGLIFILLGVYLSTAKIKWYVRREEVTYGK
ncbi:DMT family transporter [Salirhabdus salicampi]|uniref:DMT family transporter n=1 Tax=Salirhabdus salicampi TaxID=476102 RepID=UPI0020C33075|nr:DMT family transporter [Salirhabdus salicampi]MCP8616057.1 DMT family transporter [Salirhabdus salicampi]